MSTTVLEKPENKELLKEMTTASIEQTFVLKVKFIEEKEFNGKVTPAHYRLLVNATTFGQDNEIEVKITDPAEKVKPEMFKNKMVSLPHIMVASNKTNKYYRTELKDIKLV